MKILNLLMISIALTTGSSSFAADKNLGEKRERLVRESQKWVELALRDQKKIAAFCGLQQGHADHKSLAAHLEKEVKNTPLRKKEKAIQSRNEQLGKQATQTNRFYAMLGSDYARIQDEISELYMEELHEPSLKAMEAAKAPFFKVLKECSNADQSELHLDQIDRR